MKWLALLCAATTVWAAGPPLFTADYYLANPEQWLGKSVTVAVAEVDIPNTNEARPDGLRQLSAWTYNRHEPGGHIDILATPEAAQRLITACGTNLRHNVGGLRTTRVQGTFMAEETGAKRFYIYVDH